MTVMDANHRLSMAYLGDFSHDALAAPALMQAMEEFHPNIFCDAIQQRANELMREWTNQSEV